MNNRILKFLLVIAITAGALITGCTGKLPGGSTLPTITPEPVTPVQPLTTVVPTLRPDDVRVRWSGNNHLYQVVRVPNGIIWEDANKAAQALGGHLVTITSAAENDFVFSIASSSVYQDGLLLGGYQLPDSPEPDGGWVWVTGEPWNYTCWDDGEPNNGQPNWADSEERLHFHWENGSTWNDLPASDGSPQGYIVEYE